MVVRAKWLTYGTKRRHLWYKMVIVWYEMVIYFVLRNGYGTKRQYTVYTHAYTI